jgi:hypothetical protein
MDSIVVDFMCMNLLISLVVASVVQKSAASDCHVKWKSFLFYITNFVHAFFWILEAGVIAYIILSIMQQSPSWQMLAFANSLFIIHALSFMLFGGCILTQISNELIGIDKCIPFFYSLSSKDPKHTGSMCEHSRNKWIEGNKNVFIIMFVINVYYSCVMKL